MCSKVKACAATPAPPSKTCVRSGPLRLLEVSDVVEGWDTGTGGMLWHEPCVVLESAIELESPHAVESSIGLGYPRGDSRPESSLAELSDDGEGIVTPSSCRVCSRPHRATALTLE